MTTIVIDSEIQSDAGVYLTQAGALALATPCSMKDYISNNRRDKDGRSYLTSARARRDDTQISVQLVTMKDIDAAMEELNKKISDDGSIELNGVKCLFKSCGTPSMQGSAIVFSINVIKLANQS